MSALKVLPQLVETSVLKESHSERSKDRNIKEIQRLYGSIKYEGKTYPVKITVKAIQNEVNRAYTYEVMEKESPIGQEELSGQSNLDGIHENRISSTDDIKSKSDLPSTTDSSPYADVRRSVAEHRSSNISDNKDTNNPKSPKKIPEKIFRSLNRNRKLPKTNPFRNRRMTTKSE